jgi:cytochrome b pre-mRNA-processing protein 3
VFARLFNKSGTPAKDSELMRDVGERLYQSAVDQARTPIFYLRYGAPDTQTGRYEMICLHVFPILRRLKALGVEGAALGQVTHDIMFADIDRTLREQGIGDMGVGKRVKRLAAGLYGRIAAYEDGLLGNSSDLTDALRRNLYGTVLGDEGSPLSDGGSPDDTQIEAMASYLRAAADQLNALDERKVMAGEISYPDPNNFIEGRPVAATSVQNC